MTMLAPMLVLVSVLLLVMTPVSVMMVLVGTKAVRVHGRLHLVDR